jgi:hypothetical protein
VRSLAQATYPALAEGHSSHQGRAFVLPAFHPAERDCQILPLDKAEFALDRSLVTRSFIRSHRPRGRAGWAAVAARIAVLLFGSPPTRIRLGLERETTNVDVSFSSSTSAGPGRNAEIGIRGVVRQPKAFRYILTVIDDAPPRQIALR